MGLFEIVNKALDKAIEHKQKKARIETVGRALKRTHAAPEKEKVSRAAVLLARRTGVTETAAQEYIEARVREKQIKKRTEKVKGAIKSGASKGYNLFREMGANAARMHNIKPPQAPGFGGITTTKPKLSSHKYKKRR